MIDSVRNIVSYGFTVEQAVHMAATNPARIMRQEHLGLVAPGYDADLVIFNKNLNILYTTIKGNLYHKGKELCV